jgi:hypothetical protein
MECSNTNTGLNKWSSTNEQYWFFVNKRLRVLSHWQARLVQPPKQRQQPPKLLQPGTNLNRDSFSLLRHET